MRQNFPLFQSHLDLAHLYWERLLEKGDFAIDATCGAGNDTLKLGQILWNKGGGEVIGIDIQDEAILRTNRLLQENLPVESLSHIHLYRQSHIDFPLIANECTIKLIIYNLGYLPKGNKQLTTMTTSTLESVKKALTLIKPGGALCITCYPGHAEGAIEEIALLEMTKALCPTVWNVCYHCFQNRLASPSLILIQKSRI